MGIKRRLSRLWEETKDGVLRGPGVDVESVKADELPNIADYVVSSTAELQSAFNDAAAGETILVGTPATPYRTDQWLDIDSDGVTVVAQSQYAKNGDPIIKPADGANVGGIRIGSNTSVTGVSIRRVGFDGNRSNQDSSVKRLHGIAVHDANIIRIGECYITNTSPNEHNSGGSGISVGVNVTNAHIQNNEITDSGDRSIETAATNCFVDQNTCTNGYDRGISLQHQGMDGNGWVNARKTWVTNNYIENMSEGSGIKLRGLNNNTGSYTQSPRNIHIANNHCRGQLRSGISIADLEGTETGFTIANNTIANNDESQRKQISFNGVAPVNDVCVVNNSVKDCPNTEGAQIAACEGAIIANNSFTNTGAGTAGVEIEARQSVIAGNYIDMAGNAVGLTLSNFNFAPNDNAILGNVVVNYSDSGIGLSSEKNMVQSNLLRSSNNPTQAMYIGGSDNMVTNNDALNAGGLTDDGTNTITSAGNRF